MSITRFSLIYNIRTRIRPGDIPITGFGFVRGTEKLIFDELERRADEDKDLVFCDIRITKL